MLVASRRQPPTPELLALGWTSESTLKSAKVDSQGSGRARVNFWIWIEYQQNLGSGRHVGFKCIATFLVTYSMQTQMLSIVWISWCFLGYVWLCWHHVLCANTGLKNTPARDPKHFGGQEANVPDTTNCSYGTVTGEQQDPLYISIQTSSQDLHTRTSYKNFLWASQKNFHTSTNADHLQDLTARTSRGGFQQDLHKVFSQGPEPDHVRTPRGFHQDLFKSFSQGPAQDHAKASDCMSLRSPLGLLTKIFMPGPLRESHKIVIDWPCCWSGSYKVLIQEPAKSLPQELSYKHLSYMASARSSCKDLLERR